MKIWFDVDGVLANFTETYLDLLFCLTGRRHTEKDVTEFEFNKCVSNEEEDRGVWRLIASSPDMHVSRLAPHPEWVELSRDLRGAGHQVLALTSPASTPTWCYEQTMWLQGIGFHKRDIVFASDKSHVPGHVLFDDKPENCETFQGRAFLVDRPWNQKSSAPRVFDTNHARLVLSQMGVVL